MFFKKTRQRLKERVRGHVGHLAAPIAEFRHRYRSIRESSQAEPPGSFEELLEHWNCSAADIPFLKKQLRLRLWVFLAVGIFIGGFLVLQSKYLGVVILAPPVAVGLLTTLWRLHLINNRCYLPFKKWFFLKGNEDERGN